MQGLESSMEGACWTRKWLTDAIVFLVFIIHHVRKPEGGEWSDESVTRDVDEGPAVCVPSFYHSLTPPTHYASLFVTLVTLSFRLVSRVSRRRVRGTGGTKECEKWREWKTEERTTGRQGERKRRNGWRPTIRVLQTVRGLKVRVREKQTIEWQETNR